MTKSNFRVVTGQEWTGKRSLRGQGKSGELYFLCRENCHFEENPGKIELFRISMFHQLMVERTVIRKGSRLLLYMVFSIYLDEEIILVSAKSQELFGEFDK